MTATSAANTDASAQPSTPSLTISRREWRNVSLFAILVMALTTVPYLTAAAAARPGYRFGWFLVGIEDGNSYLAKMREGAVDGWLFHITYTSEPHEGAFLFTPYLAGGKIAALFASPSSPEFTDRLIVVFQVARIGFGLLLILVTYRFVAIFLSQPSLRLLAVILISVGGGLGWLLILLGQGNWLGSAPVDLISPEAFSFHLLYGLPHLSLARSAMLGGLMITFHALKQDAARRWLPWMGLAGLCWLVMGLCVPFFIGVLYLVLGAWGIGTWLRTLTSRWITLSASSEQVLHSFPTRLFTRCLVGAIIPLPLLLYSVLMLATNPVMRAWQNQNVLPSPNPLHYVLAYGVLSLFAIIAIPAFWRNGPESVPQLLLPAWMTAGPALAYFPIAVQRRLLEGIFVPLCILAVTGLEISRVRVILPRFRRNARILWQELIGTILLLTLPTAGMLLFTGWWVSAGPSPDVRLFHSDGEIAALDWLNTHAPPNNIVLSDFPIGNYLPARTSLIAFIGHGPETLNLDEKRPLAEQFLAGAMSAQEQRSLLDSNRIRWVIFSPADWQPSQAGVLLPDLELVYNQTGYRIYRYQKDIDG